MPLRYMSSVSSCAAALLCLCAARAYSQYSRSDASATTCHVCRHGPRVSPREVEVRRGRRTKGRWVRRGGEDQGEVRRGGRAHRVAPPVRVEDGRALLGGGHVGAVPLGPELPAPFEARPPAARAREHHRRARVELGAVTAAAQRQRPRQRFRRHAQDRSAQRTRGDRLSI